MDVIFKFYGEKYIKKYIKTQYIDRSLNRQDPAFPAVFYLNKIMNISAGMYFIFFVPIETLNIEEMILKII